MKASADSVSYLNAVRLDEEDVIEAIRAAIDAYDSGECYLRSSVMTTLRLFPTAPQKAKAIIIRLQALAMMMENNELRNWTQADGFTVVPAAQRALISAVADHPLSLIDGGISFEKEPRGNQKV
jgi:hypothetical protein